MIYYLLSIGVLTGVFTYLRRVNILLVCPICAGVAMTWVIGVAGIYTQQEWADPLIIAVLLAASLGGLAEKYGSKFGFIWKTLFTLIGLQTAYLIVQKEWLWAVGLSVAIVVLTIGFAKANRTNQRIKNIDIFKECC